MPDPYYLHIDVWDPNVTPKTGPYEELLNQTRYPELFSLSKKLSSPGKPYWEMAAIEDKLTERANWETRYYRYPSLLTAPINSLKALYDVAVSVDPETRIGDQYYDPTRILMFITLIARQREFVHLYLAAYITRTKTHPEIFYNKLYDQEQRNSVVDSLWAVAKNFWTRMPALV